MSYAGVYGPDETCEHDCYRKNCWLCNGSVERFAREYPERLRHPGLAEAIKISSRTITVYDASCTSPLCSWRRRGAIDKERVEADLAKHIESCRQAAADWAKASDMRNEAIRRGLLGV